MLFLGVDRVDTSSRLPLRRRKAGDDIRIHDELIIVIAPEMLLGDADLDIGAGDISRVKQDGFLQDEAENERIMIGILSITHFTVFRPENSKGSRRKRNHVTA